jgi:uncharacterized phiE125 gp8 family phage protein
MSLTLLTPPAVEPVTLAEAKARLRVTGEADDAAISHWIETARACVERETGRALLSQVWLERRDGWGGDGRLGAFGTQFRLLKPPLIALETVTLFDADDTPSEIDPAAFFIDTLADPGRIVLKPGEAWPQPLRPAGGIEIRFRCGHGETADAVPAALREAVLQIVQVLAEGGPDTGLPPVAQSLLAPYRRLTL